MQCSTNSDCTVAGCTCFNGHCADWNLFQSNVAQCPNCVTNSQCTGGADDQCDSDFGKCSVCFTRKGLPAVTKCAASSSTSSPSRGDFVPVNTNQASRDGSCSSNNNCMKGCECATDVSTPFCVSRSVIATRLTKCRSPCAKNEESIECIQCRLQVVSKAKKACIPKCISTAFLMERSLGHAAIRHFGAADVFCIPGLPCGTAGHLLRECTSDATCRLVSYGKVCQQRSDCVASKMEVSQLKHSFDWSQYHTSSGSTTLSLTSLSANPDSSQLAPSRIVAKMTDLLNQVGLGFVCDAVAMLPHRLAEMSNTLHYSESL